MKSFNPFQLSSIQETQPAIKHRGLYVKEKQPVERRYKKKHEIKNYQDFLEVNAISLTRQTKFKSQNLKKSILQKPRMLRKQASKRIMNNSKSDPAILVRSKTFEGLRRTRKESPKVSIRIKPPVLVPYMIRNTDDEEPIPCQDLLENAKLEPKIE